LEKGVWVLAEHYGKEIEETTFEVLTEARRLTDKTNEKVSALLLGHGVAHLAEALGQHGADNVYLVEQPLLEHYTTDGYVLAVTDLVRKGDPSILLLAATAQGRDLAPRLAARLNTTLVSDCAILKVNDQGLLEMTRPTFGGRVYATMICSSSRPQVITMRPGVVGVDEPIAKGRKVNIEKVDIELKPESIRTKVIGFSKASRETLDISEAEAVVAFGRGLGDKSGLVEMEELAELLEASLAGSRIAVDAGWIPFERQIGQTGKSIFPQLIICCGISGASQFTMGMQDSKFIVAINNDRQAPIFRVADVFILGDLHKIVPALIERLRTAVQTLTTVKAKE